MATKLSYHQRFYKNTVISKQHVSYFCKEKYELCMHIIVLESPHLLTNVNNKSNSMNESLVTMATKLSEGQMFVKKFIKI